MDSTMIKVLLIFLVIALLAKRSIVGPQKWFARASLCLLTAGAVLVVLTVGISKIGVLVGCGAMLAGLAVAMIMKFVEINWAIDRTLKKWRDK